MVCVAEFAWQCIIALQQLQAHAISIITFTLHVFSCFFLFFSCQMGQCFTTPKTQEGGVVHDVTCRCFEEVMP